MFSATVTDPNGLSKAIPDNKNSDGSGLFQCFTCANGSNTSDGTDVS